MPHCSKVLIVDDEALIAFDFEMTVQDAGYEVMGPATSLDEAFSMIESETPRAAILDIDVNQNPVWPLARQLLGEGTHIVFVSANLHHAELSDEFRNEARLDKPVASKDLLDALRRGIS